MHGAGSEQSIPSTSGSGVGGSVSIGSSSGPAIGSNPLTRAGGFSLYLLLLSLLIPHLLGFRICSQSRSTIHGLLSSRLNHECFWVSGGG